MDFKKCSTCSNQIPSGLFSDDQCAACQRQSVVNEKLGVVAEAAERSAYATQVAAAENINAVRRMALAKEQEAAAAVEQAKQVGAAAMMQAIGNMDDAGAQRLREHTRLLQDQQALDEIMTQLGDVVASIEGEGKPTSKINRAAYDGKQSKNETGLAAAVRWHNLVACHQILADLRERVHRVVDWTIPSSRESVLQRIEEFMARSKDLRKLAAIETVVTINRSRFVGVSAGFVLLSMTTAFGIAFGFADSLRDFGYLMGAIVSGLISIVLFCLPLSEKSVLPIAWEDMEREAGVGAKVPRYRWALVLPLPLVVGFATVGYNVHAQRGLRVPYGTWEQGGRTLTIGESGMTVSGGDSSQTLTWGSSLVRQSNAVMAFSQTIIHDGFFSDDKCSGSLTVRESAVHVRASGHADCNAFAGWWSRPASSTRQTSAAHPAAPLPMHPLLTKFRGGITMSLVRWVGSENWNQNHTLAAINSGPVLSVTPDDASGGRGTMRGLIADPRNPPCSLWDLGVQRQYVFEDLVDDSATLRVSRSLDDPYSPQDRYRVQLTPSGIELDVTCYGRPNARVRLSARGMAPIQGPLATPPPPPAPAPAPAPDAHRHRRHHRHHQSDDE